MSTTRPNGNKQEILQDLTEQAIILLGEERSRTIGPYLERTAEQLWEVSRNLPPSEIEPGFYQ